MTVFFMSPYSSCNNLFRIGALVKLPSSQVVIKERTDLIHVGTEWHFFKIVKFINAICNQFQLSEVQRQLLIAGVLQNMCSKKFCKIGKNTIVSYPVFNIFRSSGDCFPGVKKILCITFNQLLRI